MRRSFSILFVLVLLFFIIFIPYRIIQVPAFIFLLTIVISFIYLKVIYYFIIAYRKDTILRAYRQQQLCITFVVENRGPMPVHFLLAVDNPGSLEALESPQFLFGIVPWEKKECTYKVSGLKRGMYEVGPIFISFQDPLGFFHIKKKILDNVKVIIYPKVLWLKLLNKKGLPAGNIRSENKIYEDITRYRSLREYVPGDDIRRISWKVSARLGKLYCVEFLPALYFPVLIFLNLTIEDYPVRYRYHNMERAIETAASLIYYFIGKKQQVGLISSGLLPESKNYQSAPIRGGYSHAVNLLEMLAGIKPANLDFTGLLFKAEMHIPFGTRIVVISPPLKQKQVDFLICVRNKGYNVELFQISKNVERKEFKEIGACFERYCIKDYGSELIGN